MSNETSAILQAALGYAERGFSIIPCKPWDKKPYVEWEQFQHRRATREEIIAWWQEWPHAMIGVITGSISGVDIVDTDSQEADDELQGYLPESFICPTTTVRLIFSES